MKKIVLLGDSIRMIGYGLKVPEYLGEEFSVWQPKENCRFAQTTQRMLFDYRTEIEGADVVHWNNGHWDCCVLDDEGCFTPESVYVDTMLRIARWLKAHTKHVIFATTTPVRDGSNHSCNVNVRRYNEILVPRLVEMGIQINDLYAFAAEDIEGNIRGDDKIHLTEKGIELCARQIAEVIRNAAK